MDGEVLYHEYVHKSEEEKLLIKKRREEKKKLKEKRKKIQEENKKRKELQKQEHKERSLKGMQKKKESEILLQKIAKESVEENNIEEDDDAQYYRDEIGEEPDEGNFNFICLKQFRFIDILYIIYFLSFCQIYLKEKLVTKDLKNLHLNIR